MTMKMKAGFEELPRDLKYRVFGCIPTALGPLRLVSKPCKTAVDTYPGTASLTSPTELEALSTSKPTVANLAVKNIDQTGVDVSALTGLTYLRLSAVPPDPQRLNIIPREICIEGLSSLDLQQLCLHGMDVDELSLCKLPSSLKAFSYLQNPSHTHAWTWTWLPSLVNLQASNFPSSLNTLDDSQELQLRTRMPECGPFRSFIGEGLQGLTQLTSLSLEAADRVIVVGAQSVGSLQSVKDLHLINFKLSSDIQSSAVHFLPGLTFLQLSKCPIPIVEDDDDDDKDNEEDTTSFQSLKYLQLRESSTGLVRLAGPGLESLEIDLSSETSVSELEAAVSSMGQMTSLTRLQLQNFAYSTQPIAPQQTIGSPIDLQPIKQLALKELILIDCLDLELGLLTQISLNSLEKLHISDSQERQQAVSMEPVAKQQLADCGKIVLGKDHISQISGSAALFSCGMGSQLLTWRRQDLESGQDCVWSRL